MRALLFVATVCSVGCPQAVEPVPPSSPAQCVCPDPGDARVSYISQSPQECGLIFFICNPVDEVDDMFNHWPGSCGCGCVTHKYVEESDLDLCEANWQG